MTPRTTEPRRGECLSPTDIALLGNPLDFIAEDHLRIRAMCAEIDRLAGAADVDPAEARGVLDFLKEELPFLIEDEDCDLLPLLIRRSEPEDEMRRLKARLDLDHDRIVGCLPDVIAVFATLAEKGGRIAESKRKYLRDFSADMRDHLILENAIVLPFARLRLSENDLDSLGLCMLQRRGLDRVMGNDDAE